MDSICYEVLIGDGSLTRITKGNGTVMLSFTHSTKQLGYLSYKAQMLNAVLGRDCNIGVRSSFDVRTGKTYESCQWSVTHQGLKPVYNAVYPDGKKTFSLDWLSKCGLQGLALAWMDDGNLEPKARVGRLNLYEPEDQCLVVAKWIEGLTGAVGRYEDYEGNGTGRLRFPTSELVKIVLAVRDFIHPTMEYKIALPFKNSGKNALAVANPNKFPYTLATLPLESQLKYSDWRVLLKSFSVARPVQDSKAGMRKAIVDALEMFEGDKTPRAQST